MKKILATLIMCIFLVGTTSAFSVQWPSEESDLKTGNLNFSFSFEKPVTKDIEWFGQTFTRVEMPDCEMHAKTGEPRLPVKPMRILLPQETTVDEIIVETSEAKIIENVQNIELGGKTYPLNELAPTELPAPAYDKTELYPRELYNNLDVQYFRGFPILHVNLQPLHYKGESNTLIYYQDMSLQVKTKEAPMNPLYRGLDVDFKEIAKKVDNADNSILNTFKSKPKSIGSSSNAEYIIITSDSWTDDFQQLANHISSKGLSTMIKSVSDIEDEYDGEDTEADIRLFIQDAYQTMNTEWVLLAGDQEYVPARGLKDIDAPGGYDDTPMTSDMYYQCLDGDYNYDGDSYYGEKYDGVDGGKIDLYAEVYAGRASVDNEDQIDNFIAKTIAYDSYDWGSDENVEYCDSVGEDLGWNDGKGFMVRCIDHCTDYNQDTHGIPSPNQDYTDIEMTIIERYEEDGPWSDTDLENDLDDGINYFNHIGHASPTSCMKWTSSEIYDLTNSEYAFWYTQGCHPGQFEYTDDCIAEAWITADSGGFACIMNTGYGWGESPSYDGPDNRFDREFWDALYYPDEEISRLGPANQDSIQDNYWRIDDPHMYHNAYSTNLFGDPYIQIKGAEDFGADFHWDLEYPNTGDAIHFYSDSIGADSHNWNFGDGGSSNQENPTHVYDDEGVYQVTLNIYGNGETDSCTKQVEVWDNWPPEAIATPEEYAGPNPTVSFDGSQSWDPDGSVVSYHWDFDDGATSDEMSPTHTYTDDGEYAVVLTVTDDGGRIGESYCSIYIDAYTPPETEAVITGSYGKNGWLKSGAQITFNAQDWSGVEYTKYKVDDGSWNTFDDPVNVYGNYDHTVYFYSVDIWGNEESIKTENFKIDKEKPDLFVELDGEIVGDWYVSPVTVSCSGSDQVSGLNLIMYQVVGETEWLVYDNPFSVSGDGHHVVRIYAEDYAGNTEGKTDPYVVDIDMSPPVTSCDLSGNLQPDGWFVGSVNVTLDAVDSVSGVDYTLYRVDDVVDWTEYGGMFVVSSRGQHTVEFYSVDYLGNEEESKFVSFQIGAPPGSPSISGPGSGQTDVEYSFVISADHPELLDVWFVVDWGDGSQEEDVGPFGSGEEVTVSHSWSSQSSFTIRVMAYDEFGGESDWVTHVFSTPKVKGRFSFLHGLLLDLLERFPLLQRLLEFPWFDVLLGV